MLSYEAITKAVIGHLAGDLQALRGRPEDEAQARYAAAALLEHAEGMTQVDLSEVRRRILRDVPVPGKSEGHRADRGPEGREMLKSVIQEPIRVRRAYEGDAFVG
jgi:hypothetical protein